MARETKKAREEREAREKAEAAQAAGETPDDGDGSGVVTDLRRRQAERDAAKGDAAATDDAPAASGGDALDPERGESIAERAANGDGGKQDEEDDGQFAFEVPTPDGSRKITLGTFIPRGTPIEYRIVMKGKSQKGVGGLLDPTDSNLLLVVPCVVESAKPTFTRDGNGKIEKCVIYVEVTPRLFVEARTEQARLLMHGEPPSAAAGG